ncbi:hypothetical protein NLL38_01280 [Corynebacterium accolens]|uniref:hypothetical protein n=1 Tax=Corynebacterium accolens TaxID=38284 RepID=UPI001EDC6503|nr:hypothetical protein [Corynebacterium accolens]MDK4207760.1 hypothetical protein [Corynebacterium accolens]WKS69125.1 hypothetical protein NLL40_00290 [Corynebacterium accolens]WKS71580.1 hypothetical protein NLL38_01280 [Corynebacterium accolens]WKS74177.1 hypothetical protein NLL44_03100 [Corynebacterium accolens]
MKLNKRVLASVALSVSLVTTAVTPVAWAADEHLTCAQNFQAGIDIDAAINVNIAKYLQRNCNWSGDQISLLNVEELREVAKQLLSADGTRLHSEEALNHVLPSWVAGVVDYNNKFSGDGRKGPVGDEQQPGPPLMVNDVKAGDKEVTGSLFVLPGQIKKIWIAFPHFKILELQLQGNSSKGEVIPFKFDVPQGVELKTNDEISVFPIYYDYGVDEPVKVTVKSAGNGNDEAPGDGENPPMPPGDGGNPPMPPGDGGNSPKPPADDENPPKPPFPGGGAGESGSDLGSIFGVIAGLAGLAAVVASIAKIFNHGLGMLRILQPLRDFLAQFNIKF